MAANGVTAPGSTPSVSRRSSADPKEKRPAGANEPVQRFEVDGGILERGDQERCAFLVSQEQVLGVGARDRAAQRARLLHREQRGMGDGGMRDAEPVEKGEEVGGGGGHQNQ